jgi:hypothetical protein
MSGDDVTRTLTADWAIELSSTALPAQLAAEELRRTLQRIGGPALPIVTQATGPRIALHHGASGDGFVRAADTAGLVLRGDGPRGLLYAVYDLLEALGCRWLGPGHDGEFLPSLADITLPQQAVADRPAFAQRSLIIGHDLFLAEAEQWIVWAAHNRLNTIFIHTIDAELAFGACHLRSWQRRRRDLLPLLHARGMDLELGGHHLRDLLPRRMFRQQPELFRSNGQQRTPDANCCPSNPATQAQLRTAMRAFVQRFPEATVYHLWPDDLIGGGWCHCKQCAPLTPADQALLATNQLAAALAVERPDARISMLAYHDTEAPPQHVAPLPNVDLLFAPRPRTYAHGIAAPRNRPFAAHLAALLPHFQQHDQAQPAVFEYYLDGILFKSALPPLAATIAADLQHYHAAGIQRLHVLLTGDRPLLSAAPNGWLFARLAWNPEQSAEELVAQFAATSAPRSPALLTQVYQQLAQAWQAALDHDPAQEPPARVERSADPVGTPPRDVLDLMAVRSSPAQELTLEQLQYAVEQLESGRTHWQTILADAFSAAPRLQLAAAEWELAAHTLSFFAARQQLAVLVARQAPRRQVRAALHTAQQALDALMAWAAVHVLPAAQANHQFLRMIFQLHLDALEDQTLAFPWRRLSVRIRRGTRLARLLLALRLRRGWR